MSPAASPADPAMRQWSTDSVDPGRRLDYWVGAICEAFLEMDCSSRAAPLFEGRLASLQGEALSYNQVIAATQDVYRSPAAIARGRSHPFYLIAQSRSPWHVVQGGVRVPLRPGDAVLVDSAHRYELHFPESVHCLSIQIPRAWMGRWLAQVDVREARVAPRDQGWGQALSALCVQLAEQPQLAAAYPQELLADQVGAMLAGAIEPHALQPAGAAHSGLLAQAERSMRERLDQPGLTAVHIARDLGVSVRTLHRAFGGQGATFAGRLRVLRMERAAQLLAQRRLAGVSVAELGRRCGYADASHFAREFHKAWGEPPARWRQARAG
jgi:AraC-like DNA-binding protein